MPGCCEAIRRKILPLRFPVDGFHGRRHPHLVEARPPHLRPTLGSVHTTLPPLITTEDAPLVVLICAFGFAAGVCFAVLAERTLTWAKQRFGPMGRLFRIVLLLAGFAVFVAATAGFDRGEDGDAFFVGFATGMLTAIGIGVVRQARSRSN